MDIPMSNLFQQLEIEAFRAGITPRTKQSINWFRKKAETLTGIDRTSLMKEEPLTQGNEFAPGAMAMYFYDPKHKMTLPYYDTFPLVVIVGPAPGGFYGLNMHYLPPTLRAKLLDGLLDNMNNKRYDQTTAFKINHDMLKRSAKLKYFKPCYKHYLTNHVKSRFAFVPAPEWEIATFLPTANFQKASKEQVWKDSRRMINN